MFEHRTYHDGRTIIVCDDDAIAAWLSRNETTFTMLAGILAPKEEGFDLAVTPEGRIKHLVKKVIASIPGAYQHWPVQNGMGSPTLDCIACIKGHYVAVETKAPGKRPTPRQELTMSSMKAAGAIVFVVDSEAKVSDLENSLKMLQWIGNADDSQ